MSQPRSVYVHVPFCSHRCGYCNFTLITDRDDLVPAYLDALEMELASEFSALLGDGGLEIDTLFLGGGTPSYLEGPELRRLFGMLRGRFQFADGCEISCEMNPLDCTEGRLRLLSELGVNRISLGGQSFDDQKLHLLERDHQGDELLAAIEHCAGIFANVSLDLIFASPGETASDWRVDLQRAVESPLQHLSTYGLTVERGAAFFGRVLKGELAEVDAEVQLEMYEHTIDALTAAGWEHYEVSSFAKPGFRCRHNEAYWRGNLWWAFGPGAASFLPANREPSQTGFVRRVNHRSTTTYIKKLRRGQSSVAEEDFVSPEAFIRERLVFGLRRMEGVNLRELATVWGQSVLPLFEPHLDGYIRQGWLVVDDQDQLRLTRRGLVVSDGLWPNLLGE